MPRTLSTVPSRRTFVGAFAAAIALFAVGCGDAGGSKMYSVSGTVTLDDAPVAEGQITFKMAKVGKTFTGAIKDGKYDVKAEVGDMTVEIVASRVIPGKFDTTTNPGTKEPVSEMYIPRKYNTETTLTAKIEAKSNDLPFKLESAKKK